MSSNLRAHETTALTFGLARLRAGTITAESVAAVVGEATSAYRPEYVAQVREDAQRLRQATTLVEAALRVLQGGEA